MLLISCTNISPSFIFILNSIQEKQGGHPLSRYAKSSEKLTFLTPWYAHVRTYLMDGPKKHFLICSNVYDDVINFEVLGFMKNTKMWISCERNVIFSSNEKYHLLDSKGYIMPKSNH